MKRASADATIKKIAVAELKPGMYIADLCADWMDHSFVRSSFAVRDEATVLKVVEAGIRAVYIDTRRGLDVSHAPTQAEVEQQLEREMAEIAVQAAPVRTSHAEEIERASAVRSEANAVIRDVMADIRLGRQVQVERVEPVVESMTASILRNGGALLSLCRVKTKDDYTFLHSVAVCALQVAFCRALALDEQTIHLAGIGGLLHDIGKIKVSDAVLNKPGKLTATEYQEMKYHAVESRRMLERTAGIRDISIQVAYQHHERFDGSGYPVGLKGEQISQMGQMAAICDVYDAITSDRCYHKGMTPHNALRRIYEWSKFHFNPTLVQQFIRVIGIYPVGTLVMLESGRVAVVVEQGDANNLLQPRVRIVYDSRSRTHLTPEEVDLSKPLGHGGGDRIVAHEHADKWGIDMAAVTA